jgi:hypothetical protein
VGVTVTVGVCDGKVVDVGGISVLVIVSEGEAVGESVAVSINPIALEGPMPVVTVNEGVEQADNAIENIMDANTRIGFLFIHLRRDCILQTYLITGFLQGSKCLHSHEKMNDQDRSPFVLFSPTSSFSNAFGESIFGSSNRLCVFYEQKQTHK